MTHTITPTTRGTLVTSTVATPVGPFRLLVDDEVVIAGAFSDHFDRVLARLPAVRGRAPSVREAGSAAARSLAAYVDGDLGALDTVAVRLDGTAFQQRVWAALRSVECGATIGYAELARRAGRPRAVRAAGTANGRNPISILVPCHRVVPATGGVGGYSGGPDRKRWLLEHERGGA